jgi:glycosyltransferase involved in cell wall biosynthesis
MSKQIENNSQISVIIPVHLLDESTKKLFDVAIESVKSQTELPKEILVVGPKEVLDFVGKDNDGFRFVLNEGKTDFASQINLGVEKCETEWFCILEMDDELAPTWLSNVNKYKSKYLDVDSFLPIIVNREFETNAFVGFDNEAVWAAEFSTELGLIDHNCLLAYQAFNLDGMVMKKDVFISNGGLKPSMKLTFIYEFLLRITYFSSTVMVIPKFGYRHMNSRVGSLFNTYKNTLSLDEQRWWLSLAKKEYFHTKDRGITYEKN